MIDARSLTKDFGPTRALADLSFRVKRGEILGFLGPNGAGKTTAMRILTGYLRPTRGSVHVCGIPVAERPVEARRRIGYLPENAPLYDEMMVIDFLRYTAELREVPPAERDRRLATIGKRCGLAEVLGKDIGQLSKGYRQRVGLAQAMIHDPDLLILDEPTSGLDPNQIVEIRELVKELGKDKTVILSTHILPEVQATCNRILIVNEGRLVADDRPEALSGRASGASIRLVLKAREGELDAAEVGEALGGIEGIREVQKAEGEGAGTLGFVLRDSAGADSREAVFGAAVDHSWIVLDLHREQVSLEDTFRRLTLGEQEGGEG
ncbi:MAG: ATP-binding cassette domain-containing protein [Deltaproteobacteria bacterium]|nr:ATP-binding cassette domain-containing protein [Deltaproteobacteria bacterium]